MNIQTRVIEPLDVLMLRGNKSFGDAGEHATSSIPASPSVLAGALRSFWLAALGVDFKKFNQDGVKPDQFDEPVKSELGTPLHPQGFRLSGQSLAQKVGDKFQRIFPVPADLVLQKNHKIATEPTIYALKPAPVPHGLYSNLADEQFVPLLKAPAGKPESGYWLNEKGFVDYLQGKTPQAADFVKSSDLFQKDWRLGIALDEVSRTASDGQLYTTEAIVFNKDVYLVAEITGAPNFPKKGNLRLGGDGRGAVFSEEKLNPLPEFQLKDGKVKLVLSSPAIFQGGWKLPNQDSNGYIQFSGGSARVVTASIPRHQVVSGWNLSARKPKPAERIVPLGSVYWLDEVKTDGSISLQNALQQLLLTNTDPQREAEGYNACTLAQWI